MSKTEDGDKGTLFCSFCGKSQHEVETDRRTDRIHLR